MLLQSMPPGEIIRQVFGRHAMEAIQPRLESTVIGVDVLNMVGTVNDTLALAQVDGHMSNVLYLTEGTIDGIAVADQHGIGIEHRF